MWRFVLFASVFVSSAGLHAQDVREIVRKSVELDQANWVRMKDYTWIAHLTTRHFDSNGKVNSEEREAWETVILYGEPYRRKLERNGKALPPDEQHKQQEKLDKSVAKLRRETPEQMQKRLADEDKERRKQREFLRELPDLYEFRLEGDASVDGRAVWVIAATPRPRYHPQHSDAKALQKIRGRLWIDKQEYQWVRLEAESTGTISYGLFLARLNPGAKLIFEQTRINDQVWLPKREFLRGSGRVALFKRISMEQELTWNNYRKFQAESKIVMAP